LAAIEMRIIKERSTWQGANPLSFDRLPMTTCYRKRQKRSVLDVWVLPLCLRSFIAFRMTKGY